MANTFHCKGKVAVGTLVAQRPPPRSVRAALSRHGGTLASGNDAKAHQRGMMSGT